MLAKIPIEGNIVKDFYQGNAHILFSDFFCANNTPEDNQRVLDQATRASWNIILHNQSDQL